MTESPGNEPDAGLFARIQQIANGRGVDIRQTVSGNSLRLEFADGQRILVNVDAQTHNIWLAARSGGTEFGFHDGAWRSSDGTELFTRVREIMEQTIASNPLNARPPSAYAKPTVQAAPAVIQYDAKPSHHFRNILLILLCAVGAFWAWQRGLPRQPGDNTAAGIIAPGNGEQCAATMPANGSITLFPGSDMRTDGPNDPEFTLKNDHGHPALLILSAPQTAIPAMSVLVQSRQSVSLHLPPGRYDMMFSVGDTWCGPRSGFSDGTFIKFDQPLTVQMDKPMQLALQSSGAGKDDVQLFVKTASPDIAPPPPVFTGDGSMEVPRQSNGHFYVPGSIENVPATFMVDTGASVTSISSDLARQAGIRNCKEVQFQTANGSATGCIALVARMTLGNFVLENITVAVMPDLETNLLGSNVLRHFQISQSDSSMLIGRR